MYITFLFDTVLSMESRSHVRASAICLAITCVLTCTHSAAGTIISAPNRIDWTQSGIPGGIPARKTIYSTIRAAIYGSDSIDATAAIQSALNSCPANEVVYVPAGRYRINGKITIPSNVTLRGAGPSLTILDAHGSGNAVITFGSVTTPNISGSIAIIAGSTKGSGSITLSKTTGIAVGSLLMITELNDPSFVTINGSEGVCTWCDGGLGWNGTRAAGQTVMVTSISGRRIGISPPLYMNYSSSFSPLATPVRIGCINAGLENLQLYMNNTGYGENVLMQGSAYCWVLNIESNCSDGDHLQAHWSYRGEIRHSSFHDGFIHGPGSTDDDVFIADKTSGFLVIDNICTRQHVSIMLNWGASGNVIAYNYSTGNFDSGAYNALFTAISMHGSHPMFNLMEGNIGQQIYLDSVWGSGSNNTMLRNWIKGASLNQKPLTGRGPLTGRPWEEIQANRAMQIGFSHLNDNFVGNIVGSPEMLNLTFYNNGVTKLPSVGVLVAPSNRSYDAATYAYTFGYGELSDGGTGPGDGPAAFNSALIHGDYCFPTGAIIWNPKNSDHAIPNSLFLSGKPTWFGSLAWPPIDPNNPRSVSNTSIPAGYRFVNGRDPL